MMEIPANERICPFCGYMDTKESYTSRRTMESYGMTCMKGHWTLSEPDAIEQAVSFTQARTCPDFVLNPKIIEELSKIISKA